MTMTNICPLMVAMGTFDLSFSDDMSVQNEGACENLAPKSSKLRRIPIRLKAPVQARQIVHERPLECESVPETSHPVLFVVMESKSKSI
jgi:hypothetical protein